MTNKEREKLKNQTIMQTKTEKRTETKIACGSRDKLSIGARRLTNKERDK